MSFPDLNAHFKRFCDQKVAEWGGKVDRVNLIQSGYEQYGFFIDQQTYQYYGSPTIITTPSQVWKREYENGSSVEQELRIEFSEKRIDSFTWSLTEGFNITTSTSVTIGVPGEFGIGGSVSTELSFSSTQEKTETRERTWTIDSPLRIPAHTKVVAIVIIDELKGDQTFYLKCRLNRYVCSNSPSPVGPPGGSKHYYWFWPVSMIFTEMPLDRFRVSGSTVLFEGSGSFKTQGSLDIYAKVTETPLTAAGKTETYELRGRSSLVSASLAPEV